MVLNFFVKFFSFLSHNVSQCVKIVSRRNLIKLIVTYSLKYKNYQRQIRNSQIERAKVAIANKSFKFAR